MLLAVLRAAFPPLQVRGDAAPVSTEEQRAAQAALVSTMELCARGGEWQGTVRYVRALSLGSLLCIPEVVSAVHSARKSLQLIRK